MNRHRCRSREKMYTLPKPKHIKSKWLVFFFFLWSTECNGNCHYKISDDKERCSVPFNTEKTYLWKLSSRNQLPKVFQGMNNQTRIAWWQIQRLCRRISYIICMQNYSIISFYFDNNQSETDTMAFIYLISINHRI